MAYLAPPLWIAEGGFTELDLLIRRHLSKKGIERSHFFDYGVVRFIRLLHRMICRECHFRGLLNNILTFFLTVQILDDLFVRNFDANLNQRSDPATSGPLNPGMI